METIIGLLASIIGGAVSSSAHEDYADELQAQIDRQRMSPGIAQAEEIYREMAGRGLPYYEQQMAEIDTSVPTTLNQLRDYAQGGNLIDVMTNLYSRSQQQKRQLAYANEQQRLQNERQLAQFLGQVKAPAQQGVLATQTALSLAKAQEGMQKTYDSLAFAQSGAESLNIEDDLIRLLGSTDLSDFFTLLFAKKKNNYNPFSSLPKEAPIYESLFPQEDGWYKNDNWGWDVENQKSYYKGG
jgi:hypothetical protein